jgi:hypothetical protein
LNGDWLDSGNTDNLQTGSGVLTIDDTSEGYGEFESYLLQPAEEFSINRIIYNASNTRESKDRVVNVTVYGYKSQAVTASTSFLIDSDIRGTVTEGEIFNSSERFTGYAFLANLTTSDSDSPELREITVQGTSVGSDKTISIAMMWLLIGSGFLLAVKEL